MEVIDGEKVYSNDAGDRIVQREGKWIPYTPKPATASPSQLLPGPDFTGRVNQAAANLAAKGGGLINPTIGKLAGAITGAVLPSNNMQAGIDAALLASYGSGLGEVGTAARLGGKALEWAPEFIKPAARLAGRLAIPAAGGAIGGAAEGKTASGATTGVAEGLGGEALGVVLHKGAESLSAMDARRIGKWLSDRLPIRTPSSVEDLEGLFRGQGALRNARSATETVYDNIGRQLGGRQLQIPAPVGIAFPGQPPPQPINADLPQINKTISEVENLGYTLAGDPRTAVVGKAMRAAAHQMVEDTTDALNKFKPGMGDKYFKVRRQMAATLLMNRIFNESFDKETGKFSTQMLQRAVSRAGNEGYRDDLINIMGHHGADSFLDTVFRGAKPTALDIPGHALPFRAVMHGADPRAVLHMPQFAKHVGNVPFDLGRGRALAAGLVLGPVRLADVIGNYYGGAPVESSSEPAVPAAPAPTLSPARYRTGGSF